MTPEEALIHELRYQVTKLDDEIAKLKSSDARDATVLQDLQRRRDQYYDRLCQIDGLTPVYED